MSVHPIRVIARLDIKGPNVVKGIHLEGLRIVGDPRELSLRYYADSVDEIVFMDVVASLYGRNGIFSLVEEVAKQAFVPLTVGGGIRTLDDIDQALRSGADKVAINTEAIRNPAFLSEAASVFGSQCVVLSVEAKLNGDMSSGWEALVDNGRDRTGTDVMEWIRRAVDLGAGEILLTSVDREGTRKGFDAALLSRARNLVEVPIIASGGCGSINDAVDAVTGQGMDAIALADMLHYGRMTVSRFKQDLASQDIRVRL